MSKKLSQNQKTFNKVARHLLKQGCKSKEPESMSCLYRGPNNTRCAAGALIPNHLYNKSMEGKSSNSEIVAGVLGVHNKYLVRKMQIVHDNYDVSQWKNYLQDIAEEFNLVFPKELTK